jgi:heme-degrading monooxygenase HmoA
MSLKVIIKRWVPKDKERQLLPLLVELRALATSQPGYISGETLRNVRKPEECLVISTWHSAEAWEAWQSSEQRSEIQNRIDALLGGITEYDLYFYG